jgi:hypothetical protein
MMGIAALHPPYDGYDGYDGGVGWVERSDTHHDTHERTPCAATVAGTGCSPGLRA